MARFGGFFCLLFISVNILVGQNIKFKSITTKDGLSNNSVRDLISDKYGQLWVATWDGLNVYDGHKVTFFKHDQQDSLSIAGNVILKLVEDGRNQIWILTRNKAISTYKGNGVFKNYYFDDQPNNILINKDGELVVALGSKYFKFEEGNLSIQPEGQILRDESWKSLGRHLKSKHPNLIINDILKDQNGHIWYATRANGLYIIPNTPSNINNGHIDHYLHDQFSNYSITSDEIEKIYQDDFGNVWLAHKDGGLSMAFQGSENITTIVPHPIKYPHLPNETIRAITKDNEDKLWLGYYTKGLYRFNYESECFESYLIPEAKKNNSLNRIRSLYTDSKGFVWVGSYGGVIRIGNKGYEIFDADDIKAFPNNRNYSFAEDDHNNLWIACWGGLAKFDLKNNVFLPYEYQEELLDYRLRFVNAKNDLIAIATKEKGVLFFDVNKGVIRHLTTEDGLLGNSTYYIYFDTKTNYYWVATLGGVSVYHLEKGIIKNITEDDGLPSHMVYSLKPNNDQMWISTTKGIASINTEDYSVTQFPPEHGWQGLEFSEGAAYQDKRGILYYGGINGLNYTQPNLFRDLTQIPKLKYVVDGNENFKNNLFLKYDNRELNIEVIPISFSTLTTPVFYKMEGRDSNWHELGGYEIKYQDLAPGEYKFLTRIGGENGIINDVLQVRVEKPFYGTVLFYLIIFTAGSLLVIFAIVRKNVVVKRNQKKLEEEIEVRTAMIESQKKDLLNANQSLEERNNEVIRQKEILLELHHQLKDNDFEAEKFKTFVLSSFKPRLSKVLTHVEDLGDNPISHTIKKEVMGLVGLITEWDYLNQVKNLGEKKLAQVKFSAMITRLFEQLDSNKIKSRLTYGYKIHTQTELIEIDVLRFRLLIRYLLNEMLKYTGAQDHLIVTCEMLNEKITIKFQEKGTFLKQHWESAEKFSPYVKAAKAIINDLDGKLFIENTSNFSLALNLPISIPSVANRMTGKVLFKHLQNHGEISESQPIILVFCDFEDIEMVYQLLKNKNYQLVFECDIQSIVSAVRQLPIQVLVLYDLPLSRDSIQFLKQKRFQQFPTVYISEQIDMGLQEQILEVGVNSVIHLPIGVDFIHKKILSVLDHFQTQHQSKIELFHENLDNRPFLNVDEKLVKKAMGIIKNELCNPELNVDKLIGQLDISRTKCYRAFKKVMDQSPSDVIIDLRLQKAEQLLVIGNLNVSEISYECGFNDPKYFSRLFKKYSGSSPKSFQKRYSNTSVV